MRFLRALSLSFASLLASSLAACHGQTTADPPKPPEPITHDTIYQDDPFDAEVVTQLRTIDDLPDLDVRALAIDGDQIYAGTATGLYRVGEMQPLLDGAISDLVVLDGGGLLVAASDRVARIGVDEATFAIRDAKAVAPKDQHTIYAGTARGLFAVTSAGSSTLAADLEISDLLATGSGLAVAAKSGVFLFDPASGALTPIAGGPWNPDSPPRALALDASRQTLMIASADALTRVNLADRSLVITRPGRDGLPTNDLRALAIGSGEVILGHGVGASVLQDDGRVEHYHSLRWIPAEGVRAVAIGPDRTRWIATGGGISKIEYRPTTLGEKAEALEATFVNHHRMDGFVADDVGFDSPYDHSAGPRYWDNDNDGLWTQMQIGTWCLAYAATQEERFHDKARRALEVMFLEIDVPGESFAALGRSRGFISRSLVREDEGFVYDHKAEEGPPWHQQDFGGKKYYWKGSTSSDEYAGHYFGLPLYYDLCAKDEAEKEEVRRRVKLATDYVIEGNYRLIDLDGEPTYFGRWDDLAVAVDGIDGCPDKHPLEACFNSYAGGGWLNGIEILGMLLSTWHMTGEQKYYDEYERLYTVEKYGQLIPITEHTFTVTDPHLANHSDHELATLAYFTMLRYEPNEDRRAIAVHSILDFYEHEREEHNPWQLATIAAFYGPDVDLKGAITSLRDIPLDRRNWSIDNSHRLDAERWPDDRAGSPQFDRVFPYDEINALKWNSDPYNVADGFMGYDVISPTPYLIAYWMLRYYGMIQ